MALKVAATCSSWRRILIDPGTGLIVQYGRDTYAVPADLRRLLEIRDETCRCPGCRRNVACDIDHTITWAEGRCTDATNLSNFSRSHHRTKHHRGTYDTWQVGEIPSEAAEHPISTRGGTRTTGAMGKSSFVGGAGPGLMSLHHIVIVTDCG